MSLATHITNTNLPHGLVRDDKKGESGILKSEQHAITEQNSSLEIVESPTDLKKLSHDEMEKLADDIRRYLVEVVSSTGGHLASNLGVVELTLALHYVFDSPKDQFVWDVGHQAYVHKLLTGRKEMFKTLRQDDGCLGFTSPQESEHDKFGAGHAGTAISAALGMAVARDLRGGDEKVLAVIGDGSLTCGTSLEGLNNVAENTKDMIIVLNDNKMSISENVGAMTKYLNSIISGRGYNRFKAFGKMMLKRIPHGDDIRRAISKFEEATKSLFVPGVIFEELGFRYIGPIDGHNLRELTRTFQAVRGFKKNRPVIVHVITEKGRGYEHAENSPEKFHGMSCFDPLTGKSMKDSQTLPVTFSSAFGKSTCELAGKHDDVCAVTAAMKCGTGLTDFASTYPSRFFDVGIAEEHALVFACGLASRGYRPIVAIYASFLQRALDYVYHDICLHNLPVVICCDRAGVVDDGPTHHGIYNLGFLKSVPNLSVLHPKNERELRDMMFASYEHAGPVVINYPKGSTGSGFDCKDPVRTIPWGKAEIVQEGDDIAIFAAGMEVNTAKQCAATLEKEVGLKATIVNVRFMKPFDSETLLKYADRPIVTIEDNTLSGGLADTVDAVLANEKHERILHFGWGDEIIPHGTVSGIRKRNAMTSEAIYERIKSNLAL